MRACLTASACGTRLNALSLPNLYCRFVIDSRGAHTFFDLSGHSQEGLLNVRGILGRGLEERDAEAVCKFLRDPLASSTVLSRMPDRYLCNGVLDHLLIRHIALVAHKQFVDPLSGVSVNLLQPLLDIVERVHVRYIVDNADAVGSSIVRGCDGSESFLARCIPLHTGSVTF